MAPTIAGFDHQRIPVADGVFLHAAIGGSGPPVVLLHGFPQTRLMWRHVAADLAADHTDWGSALGFDAAALWSAWADDLRHTTVGCGHFMAEEAPGEVVKALRELLVR